MGLLDDARAFRAKISNMAQFAPDEMILDEPMAFDKWKSGAAYAVGDVRRDDEGLLYRCLQAHTSQPGWEPPAVPALWTIIDNPSEEWPEIRDPIAAENPYMTGDKVTFNGHHYICLIDNCVWSPSAYPAGWELVE